MGSGIDNDILSVTTGIIGHQVNCRGVMGSGLARQIRNRYPIVYQRYREYLSRCEIPPLSYIQPVRVSESLVVYNLFGQDGYGRDRLATELIAGAEPLRQKLADIERVIQELGDG